MKSGGLLGGRFRLVSPAGQGGFGTVHRSLDEATGRPLAIKILEGEHADLARFEREVNVLASLRHPNVVGYVAHGVTEEGAPYLAMEWLDGCDLASKLRRHTFDEDEALRLTLRAAEGLAAAHARGVIHRDVKPSNLFLVKESPEDVRVIDFGIARRADVAQTLTHSGTVLGTPAYMAPEQACGTRDVTPAADVFALGCVLFECLTGSPAFDGPNAHAILARVIAGPAPRLSVRKPSASATLDTLLARMMADEPSDRYADGAVAALAISDVLAGRAGASSRRPRVAAVSRHSAQMHGILFVSSDQPLEARVVAAVVAAGGVLHAPEARGLIASFCLEGAVKTAKRVAQVALELLTSFPALKAAVSMVRVEPGAELDAARARPSAASSRAGRVFLDLAAASWLHSSFRIEHDDEGAWLVGGRTPTDDDVPLVGRSRELALFEGAYAQINEECCSRLVLLLGEAGLGKTRLLSAALERMNARSPSPVILKAQADRPTATSPFELLRQLVRARYRPLAGCSAAELRETIESEGIGSVDAAFLCELVGLGDDEVVGAARRDPTVMADAIRCAWLSFVEALVRNGPVVLAVEDLHVADSASLRLLGVALVELAGSPLLVVASARPLEGANQLAMLEGHAPDVIDLRPLRPQMAAELVRALDDQADAARIDQVVSQAAGNPLVLIELAALKGGDAKLGDFTEAVEGRILRLDPAVQRAVRAASVLGLRCDPRAVAELCGAPDGTAEAEAWLRAAAAARVLRKVESAEACTTFEFSHPIFQEVAYALLPDTDRESAHAVAAAWLGRTYGADAAVVAWHYERGRAHERAFEWYAAAAGTAFIGGELARALDLADKAERCNPEGEALARVLLLRAEIAFARGDTADARSAAHRAMEASARGSLSWMCAAATLVSAAGQGGDNTTVQDVANVIQAEAAVPESGAQRVICLCRAGSQLMGAGRIDEARSLLAEAARDETTDPTARAQVAHLTAGIRVLDDDLEGAYVAVSAAARLFAAGGNLRSACLMRNFVASIHAFSGAFEAANAELDVVDPLARRAGADYVRKWARYTRGKVVALAGEPHAAREALAEVRRTLGGSPRIVAGTHVYGALAALRAGDGAWAEDEASAALASHNSRGIQAVGLAARGRALVMLGRHAEGLEAAQQAAAILAAAGKVEENEGLIHLALPEALEACGREDEARPLAESALIRLRSIAARLSTEPKREAFLHGIDTHAQTLRLAHRLGIVA